MWPELYPTIPNTGRSRDRPVLRIVGYNSGHLSERRHVLDIIHMWPVNYVQGLIIISSRGLSPKIFFSKKPPTDRFLELPLDKLVQGRPFAARAPRAPKRRAPFSQQERPFVTRAAPAPKRRAPLHFQMRLFPSRREGNSLSWKRKGGPLHLRMRLR